MLWILLGCALNYQEDGHLKSITVEQTYSAHHYNFNRAIKSSVKIISLDSEYENLGHGSGNYFKIGRDKFILSAAHLVTEDADLFADDGIRYVRLVPIYVNIDEDIAILIPEAALDTVEAVDYRISKKKNLLGNSVVYAGYPSNLEKSVYNGMISKCSGEMILMQSFALPGSSGSVVFDNSGKAIGVVSAVKMSYNAYSPFPQMHPGLVYVSRVIQYDRSMIKEVIKLWKTSK